MSRSVLVVDDEEIVRSSIRQWLELGGFEVRTARHPDEAVSMVNAKLPDVVLTDFRMPHRSGIELMRDVQRIDPDVPVVLLTAHADVALAIAAIREGVYDFLQKPANPDHMSAVLTRAAEQRALKMELRRLTSRLDAADELERRLVGLSGPMARLRQSIGELAEHDRDVIIVGESGTGKEVAARALHDLGPRARSPFVAVNCAAIPAELFESELLGHEAGAFTGARGQRIGKFEHASGGTLLLDEIESMPLPFQAKILRVLQERVVERVGSNRLIPIDIRVIAAAKTDLAADSRSGRFRSDLYFRLAAAEIHLPPLRERGNDILLLFQHFAGEAARRAGRELAPLGSEDFDVLMAHDWPGNVRELKNVAERYALGLAATGRRVAEILRRTEGVGARRSLSERVAAYERMLIEASLREHNWSVIAAMENLGLPRRTLNEKMAKYGLLRPGRTLAE